MYRFQFNTPEEFRRVVNYCVEHLRVLDFNVVVFRGFSGAIVGSPVALGLNKPWALVRKPGDSCHSCNITEGRVWGNYVIVDDFIESGNTIKLIVEAVNESRSDQRDQWCSPPYSKPKPRCLGVMLYDKQWIDVRADSEEHPHSYWKEKTGGIPILNWKEPKPCYGPPFYVPPPLESLRSAGPEIAKRTDDKNAFYAGLYGDPSRLNKDQLRSLEADRKNFDMRTVRPSGEPLGLPTLKEIANATANPCYEQAV